MDLSSLDMFEMFKRKMNYLDERQKVLSENIANADTPGYRPQDLVPVDFRDELARQDDQGLQMAATQGAHLQRSMPAEAPLARQQNATEYEVGPDGNAVILEEQMMKVAETRVDHETMVNLYNKQVSMLMMAVRR